MHLKELTLSGFKSFAKKCELEFNTAITAIVGPNGSGKSNVAEAFRFVLGEQSIKSLRGKRGEDLIFNGSERISRSNRASVSVTLLNPLINGARVFPIDFDEITIERSVNRDGTNEYAINGSKTRLKDIQELLAVANIGPTGHHIISQGESDRILTANPKERREMIEDALGLKIYQFKKAESERKLKKTLENIAHVETLRKEVAPHLQFLERQIKKLERSRKLREELKDVYIEYLRREDTYIGFHHDRLTKEREAPTHELDALEKSIEEVKSKLTRPENSGTRDVLTSLEERMRGARQKKQELARKMGQLEGQQLFIERQIAEKEKEQQQADHAPIPRAEFKKVYSQIEHLAGEAAQEHEVKKISRTLEEVLRLLKALLSKAFSEGKTKELDDLVKARKPLLEEKEACVAETEKINNEEKSLQREYEELQKQIESRNTESIESEREIFVLMTKQRELEQVIDEIDRELSILERDRSEFKIELQEAVTLLGQEVGRYFERELNDKEGKAISDEEIVAEDRAEQKNRRRELERMKIRLEELGIGSNDDILREHKEVKGRDTFLVSEISDLTTSVEKLEKLIEELTQALNTEFINGLEKINVEFKRFFTLMFDGGEAELLRVKPKKKKTEDSEEDLLGEIDGGVGDEVEEEVEEGIDIDVKLPNKRVRGLDMLSGGERALTSIALIFAMSQVNPPLFLILDETDAALDEANSRRYGDMIEALSKKSQLILITHNRETMGRAGVLYGVTMAGDGVSKLLSVKFEEAVAVAK